MPVFIKKPGIRSELSESIVYHFINEGLILEELRNPELNRNKADILAKDKQSNEIKIEVKGTGLWEFSQFTEKDVNADYLIWVNYGNYINDNNKETIDVYILKNPRNSRLKPDKISLRKFVYLAGDSIELVEIDPIRFKVIKRQYSLNNFKEQKYLTKKKEKLIGRIEIIGVLAMNNMMKEVDIIKDLKDDNKAREKFREFKEKSKELNDYIKEKNLEMRI